MATNPIFSSTWLLPLLGLKDLVRGPSPIGHIFYSFFVILLSFSFPFLFFLSTFSLFIFYVLKVIFLKKRDNVLEKITGSKNVCEL
jgi:hypothetical protein